MNRQYSISYKIVNSEIQDIFNTIELIKLLIYARINKKISLIKIEENTFVEEE